MEMGKNSDSMMRRLGKPQRDTLGYDVPVSFLRMVLLSLENILEEDAPLTFQTVGRAIGRLLGPPSLEQLPKTFQDAKIGLINIEKQAEDKVVIEMRECVGCSGMTNYNESVSQFEQGLVAGAMEVATGKTVYIREVKCCTQGQNYCQFEALLLD